MTLAVVAVRLWYSLVYQGRVLGYLSRNYGLLLPRSKINVSVHLSALVIHVSLCQKLDGKAGSAPYADVVSASLSMVEIIEGYVQLSSVACFDVDE
jgi:hypothetical protein